MIQKSGNPKVRRVAALVKKSKARREEGVFVVEGIRMFRETPAADLLEVYVSESFMRQEGHGRLVRSVAPPGVPVELLSDEVFAYLSDTRTPQGILALVRQRRWSLEDMLPKSGPAHLAVLEGLQDPGNLGTIFRAGEGAGVTGILMDRKTADVYNPKVIRSTMGSVYRVPFAYTDSLPDTLSALKEKGVLLYAAHLEGSEAYDREDYRGPLAFLIGNEAAGLSGATAAVADFRVRIPMQGRVESLNAAVAASVLMFEAARQRRGGR